MHDLQPRKLVGEVEKKPADVITFVVPWARYLRNYWRAGHRYSVGEFVVPSRSNGFEHECTVTGVTGNREPTFAKVASSSITEGTVTWTARAPTNAALDPISNSAWADGGLTVANTSVNASSQDAGARISGGEAGVDYVVVNTITTSSGDVYTFELTVKVRSNVKT